MARGSIGLVLGLALGCSGGTACVDEDGDGYGTGCMLGEDCDDTLTGVNGPSPFYPDGDGDGFGAMGSAAVLACTMPAQHAPSATDCDDANVAVSPGATESCNGVDDNCDFNIDEGMTTRFYRDADSDTYGDGLMGVDACGAPAGYVTDATDCDDGDGLVHRRLALYTDVDRDGRVSSEPALHRRERPRRLDRDAGRRLRRHRSLRLPERHRSTR